MSILTSDLWRFGILIIIFKCVNALNKHEEQYFNNGHLSEIPTTFEVKGENAKTDFKKYVNEIQALTAGKNMTPIYKVTVGLTKPLRIKNMSKDKKLSKKLRTKKYNVPLKRQNMKLSNFEVLLRKLAEETGQKVKKNDSPQYTTNKPNRILTTKLIQMKYKPVIHQVKTNYTKIIKPVRSKTITLTA